jgi:hypothetical protein
LADLVKLLTRLRVRLSPMRWMTIADEGARPVAVGLVPDADDGADGAEPVPIEGEAVCPQDGRLEQTRLLRSRMGREVGSRK